MLGSLLVALVVTWSGTTPVEREVRFQGALVAQADAPLAGKRIQTIELELARLTRERPSLTGPLITLSVGVVVTLGGFLAVILPLTSDITARIIIGGLLAVGGLVAVIVGAILIPVAVYDQHQSDKLAASLRQELEALRPQTTGGLWVPMPMVALAQF